MFNAIRKMFKATPKRGRRLNNTGLSFDGLNPLLAKQLSELESQLGQLAQVQFELSQERQRMRIDMEALRKAVGQPAASPLVSNSDNEATQ